MPHISVALPGIEDTVTRAAMYGVIQDVLRATGLDPNTRLVWPREVEMVANGGGSIDDATRDAVFASKRTVYIEVKERDNVEETLGPGGIHRKDSYPVFYDAALGIDLAPIHSSKQVEISIRYTTPDRTEARRWSEDMFMRTANYRDRNLHTLDYSYLLPDPMLSLLVSVYKLREAVAGYGEDFKTWFTRHVAKSYTLKSDMAGKNQALAFNERQGEVIGYFDIGLSPEEPVYDRDAGTYTVEFPYKLSYLKPVGMRAKYPIVVHSQLLPKIFIDFTNGGPDPTKLSRRYPVSNLGFGYFSAVRQAALSSEGSTYYTEPSIDDWSVEDVAYHTKVCQVAVVPPDEPTASVWQLTDMEEAEYPDAVLRYMRESEWSYMHLMHHSLFYVVMYEDDQPIASSDIRLDKDLHLYTTYAMDLRKRYHVVVYMCVDPSRLVKDVIERLRYHADVYTLIIEAINRDVQRIVVRDSGVVTLRDIEYWRWLIYGHGGISTYNGAGVIGSLTDDELSKLRGSYTRQRNVQLTSIIGRRTK